LVETKGAPEALVLELYGTGNAPSTKRALLALLSGAAGKVHPRLAGVRLVHATRCAGRPSSTTAPVGHAVLDTGSAAC
jgi:hypothetical protein